MGFRVCGLVISIRSPEYPNINTYMDRTIGSHDYRAISIPENRWIVPGARGSRGAYDFGIYPCDEVCVTSDGGHNKLLMDTERVDGYFVAEWVHFR